MIPRPYLGLPPKAFLNVGLGIEIRLVKAKVALDKFKQTKKTLFRTIATQRKARTESKLNSAGAKDSGVL